MDFLSDFVEGVRDFRAVVDPLTFLHRLARRRENHRGRRDAITEEQHENTLETRDIATSEYTNIKPCS